MQHMSQIIIIIQDIGQLEASELIHSADLQGIQADEQQTTAEGQLEDMGTLELILPYAPIAIAVLGAWSQPFWNIGFRHLQLDLFFLLLFTIFACSRYVNECKT